MEMQAIIEVKKPVRCESCGEILAWERVKSYQVQYLRGAVVNNILSLLSDPRSAWCKSMTMLSDDELDCIYEMLDEDTLSRIGRVIYRGEERPFLRFEKVASSNDSSINREGVLIAISLISLLCLIVSAFQLFLSEFDFTASTINVLVLLLSAFIYISSQNARWKINSLRSEVIFNLASYAHMKCSNCGNVSNEKIEDKILSFEIKPYVFARFNKEKRFDVNMAELTANDLSKLSEIIRKGEGAESERSKYITRKIKEFTEDMTAYDAQIVMEIVDMF